MLVSFYMVLEAGIFKFLEFTVHVFIVIGILF